MSFGYLEGSICKYCYNRGEKVLSTRWYTASSGGKKPATGGIAGHLNGNSKVQYTYSTCNQLTCDTLNPGLIVGYGYQSSIKNSFGLECGTLKVFSSKSSSSETGCRVIALGNPNANNNELTQWSQETIDSELKDPNDSTPVFVKATNKNGGYPILNWQ